jgi:hypothetical protein
MQSALLDVVVVVAVAVAPRSPPSPITGIRQTRTPDTPVDVFVVTAVVDVALSPPLPSAVVAVFDREKARRGRPNANDSAGREREASALASRDGGGGGGGTAMVVHRRRGCRHRRHHPPLSNAAATAAVVVHDTVLQCIARRHLSPSQWWLIVIWSRCLRRRLPTNGGRIRVGGIVKLRRKIRKKGRKKGVYTTQ